MLPRLQQSLLLTFLAPALWLGGCKTVPVLDDQGRPTGETKQVLDEDALNAAVGTTAPLLPWPFSALIPIGAAALVALKRGKPDAE